MEKFVLGDEAGGLRADIFITEKYPQFSRSALKGLFEQERVLANGKPAKAGYNLRSGDVLEVDDSQLFIQPKSIDLPIVYEDDDVLVINKPPGILTHSKGALNLEPTVASFIKTKLNDDSLSGGRAGIVHRLDRGTSGLIIGAKNQKSLDHLQKQFSSRRVKKTYLAVVEGIPNPESAIINVPISRNPKKPQTFIASSGGKPARTHYKVLKKRRFRSLVELIPETGRTHQLRVHMAYIGTPIAGDAVYGRGNGDIRLHAYKLELSLPSGKAGHFTVPPPKNFEEPLENE